MMGFLRCALTAPRSQPIVLHLASFFSVSLLQAGKDGTSGSDRPACAGAACRDGLCYPHCSLQVADRRQAPSGDVRAQVEQREHALDALCVARLLFCRPFFSSFYPDCLAAQTPVRSLTTARSLTRAFRAVSRSSSSLAPAWSSRVRNFLFVATVYSDHEA